MCTHLGGCTHEWVDCWCTELWGWWASEEVWQRGSGGWELRLRAALAKHTEHMSTVTWCCFISGCLRLHFTHRRVRPFLLVGRRFAPREQAFQGGERCARFGYFLVRPRPPKYLLVHLHLSQHTERTVSLHYVCIQSDAIFGGLVVCSQAGMTN